MTLRLSEEEYAVMMARRTSSGPAGHLPQRGRQGDSASIPGKTEKRAKYGNRRVEVDGMRFDSRHEADYYFGVLVPRVKAGELKCVCRQVPFDLPGGIKYIADFLTVSVDGHVAVIDAKSAATRQNRVYINKKKQMKAIWGIEIMEV